MNNLVFTGPESSGKTTLAKQIAQLKQGVFVEEYAREYLTSLNKDYSQCDLLEIAKGQFKIQEEAKKQAGKLLCFDTDLLTIKIWSEVKYGTCDEWILNHVLINKDFTYILCYPDIPWEPDPLRENPNDREELYEIYKDLLIELDLRFIELRGNEKERVVELERILFTQ